MVQIEAKGTFFAMENVLHVRHSAAKRPLLATEPPKITKMLEFYRRKKMSRCPLRSGMTIYGPERYRRHAFCDGKRVARSPLRSETSSFDPPSPTNGGFVREGRAFFLYLPFCTRGTSLFCPTWVQHSKTRHFTREVRRFFVKRSKIPNSTDENALARGARGQMEHREAAPTPLWQPEKSIFYR